MRARALAKFGTLTKQTKVSEFHCQKCKPKYKENGKTVEETDIQLFYIDYRIYSKWFYYVPLTIMGDL